MLLTRINISQVPEPSSDFFHFFPKIFLVKRFLSPLSAANSFQANALKQNFFLFLRSFFFLFFYYFFRPNVKFHAAVKRFFSVPIARFLSLSGARRAPRRRRISIRVFPSIRVERPSSPPRFVIIINIAASTSAAKRFKTRRRAERNGRRRKS